MSTLPAFSLGSAVGLYLVTSTRVSLWRKDDQLVRMYLPDKVDDAHLQTNQDRHLFFGPAVRRWAVTKWNTDVVDAIAKPVIASLAEKGW